MQLCLNYTMDGFNINFRLDTIVCTVIVHQDLNNEVGGLYIIIDDIFCVLIAWMSLAQQKSSMTTLWSLVAENEYHSWLIKTKRVYRKWTLSVKNTIRQ